MSGAAACRVKTGEIGSRQTPAILAISLTGILPSPATL